MATSIPFIAGLTPWSVLKLAVFAEKTYRRRVPFELEDLETAYLVHKAVEGEVTIDGESMIECRCGERFLHRERLYAGEKLVAHQHESARKIALARRILEKSEALRAAQKPKQGAAK